MKRNLLPVNVSPYLLLDRVFNDEWPDVFKTADETEPISVEEIREDDAIVIRADIPGVDPEKDVEVTVSDGSVHIRAERQQKSESSSANFYRSEIRYGSFSRVLPLPAGATEDDVKATCRNGVLEVRVPVSPARPKENKKRIPITES